MKLFGLFGDRRREFGVVYRVYKKVLGSAWNMQKKERGEDVMVRVRPGGGSSKK